jgi:hypothetical protein
MKTLSIYLITLVKKISLCLKKDIGFCPMPSGSDRN